MTAQRIAASYGRTSKEFDDAFSVSSQLDADREYGARISAKLPKEYEFAEDYTGKSLDRPEYNKIRELIRNRKINILIVYATDRFARKVGVGDFLLDELFRYGVELHIVAWGAPVRNVPEDRMRFNMEMSFSDFERLKIIERTTRGKRKKATEGKLIGNGAPLYGYDKVGIKPNLRLVPNRDQAATVRLIFDWLVTERVKVVEIQRRLTARGITAPGELQDAAKGELAEARGRTYEPKQRRAGWGPHTLYRIIRNEAYCGVYWQNRTKHVARTPEEIEAIRAQGRKITKSTEFKEIELPRSEWLPVAIEPIISRELWEAAQIILDEGLKRSQSNKVHNYLVARRIRCQCGKSRTGVSQDRSNGKVDLYYYCVSAQCVDGACNYRIERAPDVDYTTWAFVKELLTNPERLFVQYEAERQRKEADNALLRADVEQLDAKIAETQQRLSRALVRLDAAEETGDQDEIAHYEARKAELKAVLADLRAERATVQGKLAAVSVPEETVRSLAKIGEEYRDLLNSPDLPFDFMRGIIDDLQLGVITVKEDGVKYLDFVWAGRVDRRVLGSLQGSRVGP